MREPGTPQESEWHPLCTLWGTSLPEKRASVLRLCSLRKAPWDCTCDLVLHERDGPVKAIPARRDPLACSWSPGPSQDAQAPASCLASSSVLVMGQVRSGRALPLLVEISSLQVRHPLIVSDGMRRFDILACSFRPSLIRFSLLDTPQIQQLQLFLQSILLKRLHADE